MSTTQSQIADGMLLGVAPGHEDDDTVTAKATTTKPRKNFLQQPGNGNGPDPDLVIL